MPLPASIDAWIKDQTNAVIFMKKKDLAIESSLLVTKWPEYRFLTPLMATKFFVKEFRTAYAACLRVNIDREKSERSRAASQISFEEPGRGETAAWRARQLADEFGLPYPDYLRFCFDFAMRRQRNSLPYINQLMPSKPNARDAWLSELHKFWSLEQQQYAYDRMEFVPQLADPDCRNLPAREAFADTFLEGVAERIGNLADFVGRYVISRNYISVSELSKVIDATAVKRAMDRAVDDLNAGMLSLRPTTVSKFDRMQACFGLPGAAKNGSEPCKSCPQAQPCAKLSQIVTGAVESRTGHIDPRAEHAAQKNREYVSAHRARKRSSKAVS